MNDERSKHALLCIICPEGCEIEVEEHDGTYTFSEGICRRGQDYARQEIRNPVRTLTSTVPIADGDVRMLPVRAADPIPKPLMHKAMAEIKSIHAVAPVAIGDTIIPDLAGTGIALVATRTIHRCTSPSGGEG